MLAKDLTFCAAIDVTEVLVRLVKCNVKDRENLSHPIMKRATTKIEPLSIFKELFVEENGKKNMSN